MSSFDKIEVPAEGEKITFEDGKYNIPDNPIIPYVPGDGTGKDISPVMTKVVSAAVEKTYGGKREINWMKIHAGETADEIYGTVFPDETLDAIREFRIAIKGPLTTPVGAGFRSLNVAFRKELDLYACIRPVYFIEGLPSPIKNPEAVDMVIFRENTEDVYAGIEWEAGTPENDKFRNFIDEEMDTEEMHPGPIGLGVKPISEFGTKRLVRQAIEYAIRKNRDSVTLVHKGNIMKFTEGAFRNWGYEVAAEEFPEQTISEEELWEKHDGDMPEGKILIKDRIADNMLQQLLTRTADYDVLALPNLNGDYISDAAGGMIGGLGIAPGANIGDGMALFEPTHGSAPKHAGKDKVNPTAILLSACEMLDHMRWEEAAVNLKNAIQETINQKTVTYDLERQMEGATKLKCSEYGDKVIANLEESVVAV